VLTVRRAGEADAAVLAAVTAEAYRHYVPRIGREPAPMTADYAHAARSGLTWVAEADGEVVGLLVLVVHPDHLLVENVAVRPSAQRRGVGAWPLAEDEARARGLDEIRLYTNEAMTENLAYYPRHGYTETHRAGQGGFRRVFFTKHLAGR